MTPFLLGANALYFAAAVLFGVSAVSPEMEELLRLGANFGPLTFSGEWWRVLSTTFVHIGFIHLAFNMWCLWALGNIAERMFGNLTFLSIYVASGIGGSLAGLIWHPHILSAGASGAVFGVAGALVAFLRLGNIEVPRQVVRELFGSLLFFVGFNLFFGAVVPGIDNAGHLGGLVVGLALGAVLHRPLPAGRRSWTRFLALPATGLIFLGAARMAYERGAEDPRLLAATALLHLNEGKRAEAIAELERAVASDPDFAEGFRELGRLQLDADRVEQAVASLEQAVRLEPKSALSHTQLGYAYLRAEKYDEAISTFREAVELDPQLYEPQRLLAISLREAGRLDEAQEEFRIARQMEPSDVSTYLRSSRLLIEANRFEEAREVLEEARTWDPDSAVVLSELGLVHLLQEDEEGAVDFLRKAAELEPNNPEHHNRLALALARKGEHESALREIETALEMLPDAPHLLDSLGTVYFYGDEPSEAADAYRRAIELAPEEAVYHYNLSVALERQGRTDQSREARERAFDLNGDLSVPPDGHPVI